VYNKDTNAGVHSATIVATWTGRELKTKTDNDGRYRFEKLPSGNCIIRLEAGTGVPGVPHQDTNRVRLTLRPDGHARELDFPLELGLTLSGHVRDRHGAPIEGANINAKHSAISDSEGAFSVAGYQAGDETKLRINKSDFAEKVTGPFTIPPRGLSGVRIELVPESLLSGTVVDRNGNEVPRASVKVVDEHGRVRWSSMQGEQSARLVLLSKRQGGDFEFRGLPGGTYRLFVDQMPVPDSFLSSSLLIDRRPRPEEAPLAEVSLAEGQHLTGVRLVMDSGAIDNYKDSAQKISGYVRNSEGEPVANARLDPSYFDAQLTDANGYFEVTVYSVEGQPSGPFARLQVSAKGYSPQWVRGIDSSVSTRDIVLERLSRIVGRVVDAATDEPIQSFEVAKGQGIPPEWDPDRWNFEAVHNSKGRFVFDNLEGRSVGVAVRAPGYSPNNVRISLDAGTDTEVEFALEPGWPIEGVVLDPQGEPVEGAQVRIGEPDRHLETKSGHVAAFTDPDGSFYINPVPRSVTQLFAHYEGYLPTTVDYAHDPDHATYITFRLNAGSILEGTISFVGVPVANQGLDSAHAANGIVRLKRRQMRVGGSDFPDCGQEKRVFLRG
jgi:protocatechuate 3,4-dioxygenase beta subunit